MFSPKEGEGDDTSEYTNDALYVTLKHEVDMKLDITETLKPETEHTDLLHPKQITDFIESTIRKWYLEIPLNTVGLECLGCMRFNNEDFICTSCTHCGLNTEGSEK